MTKSNVYILVEGQTEERFVKELLQPHLSGFGVLPTAVVVETKHVEGGTVYRGGSVTYASARKQIMDLLCDFTARAVTTMFDYYGLERSFPGRRQSQSGDCFDEVVSVEQAINEDIGIDRFFCYLSLHEYEGLLFSSPEAMAAELSIPGTPEHEELVEDFNLIRNLFEYPERINDDPCSCPSNRIVALAPNYDKVAHGSKIASQIGLQRLRDQCPHFRVWLERLETLSA